MTCVLETVLLSGLSGILLLAGDAVLSPAHDSPELTTSMESATSCAVSLGIIHQAVMVAFPTRRWEGAGMG